MILLAVLTILLSLFIPYHGLRERGRRRKGFGGDELAKLFEREVQRHGK